MQTYHWSLRERPYSDQQAKKLLAPAMDAKTSYWHYRVHQKGYVDALNKIEQGLRKAKKANANGNYSVYGELKRRFPWDHSGALLHDVYWLALGGNGSVPDDLEIIEDLAEQFGSYENWKADFIATAKATKLSGWAVLVWDQMYSGRLLNVLVDEHQNGAIWGGIPLLSLDMFEHSYYHKFGPDREKYIEGYFSILDWERINEHYLAWTAPPEEIEDE